VSGVVREGDWVRSFIFHSSRGPASRPMRVLLVRFGHEHLSKTDAVFAQPGFAKQSQFPGCELCAQDVALGCSEKKQFLARINWMNKIKVSWASFFKPRAGPGKRPMRALFVLFGHERIFYCQRSLGRATSRGCPFLLVRFRNRTLLLKRQNSRGTVFIRNPVFGNWLSFVEGRD